MNVFHHNFGLTATGWLLVWWKMLFFETGLYAVSIWLCWPIMAEATDNTPVPTVHHDSQNSGAAAAESPGADGRTENHFYIREYRVQGGGHLLPNVEVEQAVYPYLGPYRTTDDVEKARGALEQAYRDKGYQTVSVQIPQQQVQGGVIKLDVMQGEVGRLRVHGSRYFSIDQIKREAPSLQEGQSPNFSQVTHDLLVLNG